MRAHWFLLLNKFGPCLVPWMLLDTELPAKREKTTVKILEVYKLVLQYFVYKFANIMHSQKKKT